MALEDTRIGQVRINTESYGDVKVPIYDQFANLNYNAELGMLRQQVAVGPGSIPTLPTSGTSAFDFWRIRTATETRYVHVGEGLLPQETAGNTEPEKEDVIDGSHDFQATDLGDGTGEVTPLNIKKFGDGRRFDGLVDGWQTSDDGIFSNDNEFAITIAFTFGVGAFDGTSNQLIASDGSVSGSNMKYWSLNTNSAGGFGPIVYDDHFASPVSTTGTLTVGTDYSLILWADNVDEVNDTRDIHIKVLDSTGAVVLNELVDEGRNNSAALARGNVELGADFFATDSYMPVDVYQVRHWGFGGEPTEATLTKIADPTDPDYYRKLEGNERAAWFMEPVN